MCKCKCCDCCNKCDIPARVREILRGHPRYEDITSYDNDTFVVRFNKGSGLYIPDSDLDKIAECGYRINSVHLTDCFNCIDFVKC